MASPAAFLVQEAIARGLTPRRAPAPTTELPRHVERDYLRELVGLLRSARQLIDEQLVPELGAIVREADPAVADSLVVDRYADRIEGVFRGIRLTWGRRVSAEQLAEMARRAGHRTANANRLKSKAQWQALLGINVAAEPGMAGLMQAFTQENVALITSVHERYFSEIEALVLRNARAGIRAESLAREVRARYGVAESRAALIARDQTGKLNGDITRVRQTAVGVTHYIWRTSRDERVRHDHAVLEGQVISWKEPPIVDARTGRRAHPGGDFQCRCTAEPVLPGINEGPQKRPLDKHRSTPPSLVPRGVPEGYSKHEAAPVGRFSSERLRQALPLGRPGSRLTREQQGAVRRELNGLLAQEGMVERTIVSRLAADEWKRLQVDLDKETDPVKRTVLEVRVRELRESLLSSGLPESRVGADDGLKASTYSVTREPEKYGAAAFHESVGGRIAMMPRWHQNLVEFARTPNEKRTGDMVRGFQIAVHETVHGHSPMHPRLYQGLGMRLEEATTELAAQAIAEKAAPGWSFTFAESSGGKTIRGAYSSFITATVRAIADDTGVAIQKAKDLARTASIRMRRHTGGLFRTYEDYAHHFARQLPRYKRAVAKAERDADTLFSMQLQRARAGELGVVRRMVPLEIKSVEDLDRPDVVAEVNYERRRRREAAGAGVTKAFVDRLSAELRGAQGY